jgi:hypothetical protein
MLDMAPEQVSQEVKTRLLFLTATVGSASTGGIDLNAFQCATLETRDVQTGPADANEPTDCPEDCLDFSKIRSFSCTYKQIIPTAPVD